MADPEDFFGGDEAELRLHTKVMEQLNSEAQADRRESVSNILHSSPYLGATIIASGFTAYHHLVEAISGHDVTPDRKTLLGATIAGIGAIIKLFPARENQILSLKSSFNH